MALTQNIYVNVPAWASATYAAGAVITNAGNGYVCNTGGTSTVAPTGTGGSIQPGGTAVWGFLSTVDYTDLQSWANGLPATLTQAAIGRVAVGAGNSINAVSGATLLTLSGHATTSTNSITLTAMPGLSFRDTLRNNSALPLAFNVANGPAIVLPASGAGNVNYIVVTDDWVTFDGLQFQDPNSGSVSTIIQSGANFTLQNSIVDGFSQGGGAVIIEGSLTGASSSVFKMRNVLVIDRGTTGGFDSTIQVNYNTVFANNTFVQLNAPADLLGLHLTGGAGTTFSATNNIFFGWSAADVVGSDTGATGTVSFSVTDVASFTGTGVTTGSGNKFGKTAAAQFVSATTNFRLLATADANNGGTADTTDVPSATDILGVTRPQGVSWDVGAVEFPATNSVGTSAGSSSASGVSTSGTRSVGTAAGSSSASGVSPASRGVGTAAGSSSASGATGAIVASIGTAAGSSSATASNSIGALGSTISLNPVPPQSALQPFQVTGSIILHPQLQFAADSSSSFTSIPQSGVTPLAAVPFQFQHPGAGLGSHAITVQDLSTGSAAATNFLVDVIGGSAKVFPPLGPVTLQDIIPSYLYQEYFDDDDLQAFIAAYNAMAQTYLDWFNQIALPVYTGPMIVGTLLDWVAQTIYGVTRPTIATVVSLGRGPFNTWEQNTLAINAGDALVSSTVFPVTDEIFKRIITWHVYKGDGRQFTIPWLKRRIMRFLGGAAGADFNTADTSQVSVSFVTQTNVRIKISQGAVSLTYAPVLQAALLSGTLPLPFQLKFDVLLS